MAQFTKEKTEGIITGRALLAGLDVEKLSTQSRVTISARTEAPCKICHKVALSARMGLEEPPIEFDSPEAAVSTIIQYEMCPRSAFLRDTISFGCRSESR